MKRTMPFFYALPVSLLALMLLAGGLRSNVSAAEYSGTFEGCEAMDGADQCLLVTEDAKQLFLIGNAARVSAVLQNTPNNLIDILKTSQTGRRITVYGTVNEFGELTDVTNVVFQDAPPLSGEGLDRRAKIRGRFAGCEQKMDIMDCSVAGDDGNTYFVNAPIGQASTIFTNTPKTVFDAIHPAGWNGRMVVIEGEIDAESQQFSSVYNIYLDEAAAAPQTQTAQPSRGNAQSLGNLAGEPGRTRPHRCGFALGKQDRVFHGTRCHAVRQGKPSGGLRLSRAYRSGFRAKGCSRMGQGFRRRDQLGQRKALCVQGQPIYAL